MNSTITINREAATPRLAPLSTQELELTGGDSVTAGGIEMGLGIFFCLFGPAGALVGVPLYVNGLSQTVNAGVAASTPFVHHK